MISGTVKKQVEWCHCGRLIPCPRHEGKPVPVKIKRVGRYSGYSKTFVVNGGAEELLEGGD